MYAFLYIHTHPPPTAPVGGVPADPASLPQRLMRWAESYLCLAECLAEYYGTSATKNVSH